MANQVNGLFPGELQPSTTVGGCIDIFEKAWPNPAETLKLLENECRNPDVDVYWERAGTIEHGSQQNARTNDMLLVSKLAAERNNGLLQNIHNQFNFLLLASSIPYALRNHMYGPLYHEPYSLLKYKEGTEYKAHFDGTTDTGRCISALVYLNDDYEGGELEFPHFNIKIKPQAGMLILFPSNFAYTHIAHPVKSGVKYNLVTWIADRNI